MKLIDGIPVFGTSNDDGALNQIKTCARTAHRVALMADHHRGYAVPIGGVVAYKDAISPSGVGYDIGCVNKAVSIDTPSNYVRDNIQFIMDNIFKTISFGVGRYNEERVEHPMLEKSWPGWELEATRQLRSMAQSQLGTVGSGNHYVDIFTDEFDRVWIGVHFGSRGLGHKTATWFLEKAGAKDGMDVEPCVLPAYSDLGEQYIKGMTLAGQYAYAGRDWVCQRVAQIMGGQIIEEVHNHHNFAWFEEHNGENLWVVRKGATPAFPGLRGFVGSSMGEDSVILEGVENPMNIFTLCSTVHGAGRTMGRREAAGKSRVQMQWQCRDYRKCSFSAPKGGFFKGPEGSPTPKCPQCGHKLALNPVKVQLSDGKITAEMMNGWLQRANVVLRGGGRDESPDCYKRLPEVLRDMGETIRVLHTLRPLGVAMAGENEYDPFKD